MRMTKAGGILFLCLALIGTCLIPAQPAFAATAEELPPPPTEGVASDDPYVGEGSIERPQGPFVINALRYLEYGHSYITWVKDNVVRISGDTTAKVTADIVGIKLYLQRWNPSQQKWEDVVYGGDFKKYNHFVVLGGVNIQVPKGYFYRARAIHYVTVNGITEQAPSTTTYIYVP